MKTGPSISYSSITRTMYLIEDSVREKAYEITIYPLWVFIHNNTWDPLNKINFITSITNNAIKFTLPYEKA